ncbi:MAG: AcrR family transcriptional regulator [Saprospiraceae bacterium]|jgi:AcrR family transcriptional regulator
MNKTKKKIILAAIEAFNEQGLTNVRNQDIAERAGISLSNFNYHFGAKKDLVLETIKYMRDILANEVYGKNHLLTSQGQSLEIAMDYFEFERRFRFFYLDTHNILQTYPELKEELKKEIDTSINMIKNVNYIAIGKGLMKPPPEDFPDLYDKLAQQVWMNNHFWFAQATIRGMEGDFVKQGLESILAISYPHLTEKGLERFRDFLDKSKIME